VRRFRVWVLFLISFTMVGAGNWVACTARRSPDAVNCCGVTSRGAHYAKRLRLRDGVVDCGTLDLLRHAATAGALSWNSSRETRRQGGHQEFNGNHGFLPIQ